MNAINANKMLHFIAHLTLSDFKKFIYFLNMKTKNGIK